MKIVLTCGHPTSGYEIVYRVLLNSGLFPAGRSRRENFSAEEIQKKLCQANDVQPLDVATIVQIQPGKVWQNLAVDLFVANLDHENWGWADPNTIYLLDFWRDFDPQTRFVLTYNSPANALAGMGDIAEDEIKDAVRKLLVSWRNYNEQLLHYYTRHKNRCLLINADAVERVDGQEKLLPLLRDQRGLSLSTQVVKMQPSKISRSAILGLVASQILEEIPEIQALYDELESTADIFSGETESRTILAEMAVAEYQRMASSIGKSQHELEVFSAERKHEHHIFAEQIEAMEDNLAVRERELAFFQAKLAEANDESDLILQQLHQVQEDLVQHALKARDLGSENQHLLAHLASVERELADLKGSISDKQKTQSQNNSQTADLVRENELLLLQLHQVQEELEHYFLKYHEVSTSMSLLSGAAKSTDCVHLVNMKDRFQGENWYPAEADGCWAGPERHSTLKIPVLEIGEYCLELKIVDAMNIDIAHNTALSFNGRRLVLKQPVQPTGPLAILSGFFKKKKRYPFILMATFRVEAADLHRPGTLEFDFPFLISPAERGSADRRRLSIRLGAVRITALQGESAIGLDMRSQIVGENWYHPESDGRWAGPAPRSSLKLPAARAGRYFLAIEVVDAMSQEIIDGIQCHFAGKSVMLAEDDSWAGWSRKLGQKNRYPRTLQAEIQIFPEQDGKTTELELFFPRLVSPSSKGSSDQRQLAVRIKSIVLTPLNTQ